MHSQVLTSKFSVSSLLMYRRVVWLADGGEVLQKRMKLEREMQNIVHGFKKVPLG